MKKPSENLPRPKWIKIEDFEFMCFSLTKELMEFNEPIPDYSNTDLGLLESSLAAPRNSFELNDSSLAEQASVLFYSLIKNHPFKNGNKRIAVMTLLSFLFLNDKWLEINPTLLYETAVLIARSDPSERDQVVKAYTDAFGGFIVKRKA